VSNREISIVFVGISLLFFALWQMGKLCERGGKMISNSIFFKRERPIYRNMNENFQNHRPGGGRAAYDLTGQRFGQLTARYPSGQKKSYGGVWWTCQCDCGREYDVPATLLVQGKRTHCPNRCHQRSYASADIAGQRFHRLTALYPTPERDAKGSVVWHCRCDCGSEIDLPYNSLVYSNQKSCGCRKQEHNRQLQDGLIHVAGTSIDSIRSRKIPASNTTGCRGVYMVKGRYAAKIVFQQKQYYLGTYANLEDAVRARRRAEQQIFDQTTEYYDKWQQKAAENPLWAAENPISITVSRANDQLIVSFSPPL